MFHVVFGMTEKFTATCDLQCYSKQWWAGKMFIAWYPDIRPTWKCTGLPSLYQTYFYVFRCRSVIIYIYIGIMLDNSIAKITRLQCVMCRFPNKYKILLSHTWQKQLNYYIIVCSEFLCLTRCQRSTCCNMRLKCVWWIPFKLTYSLAFQLCNMRVLRHQ